MNGCSIGLIVLNYNDYSRTVVFLKMIRKMTLLTRVLVVDNCSTDESFSVLKKYEDSNIEVIKTDKNGGYGYGNNYGLNYLRSHYALDYFLICNPDVLFTESTVYSCVEFLSSHKNDNFSIVAPSMMDVNKNIVNSAWYLPSWKTYLLYPLHFLGKKYKLDYVDTKLELSKKHYCECDCVAGSFFMISSEAASSFQLFDESIFLFCEEMVLGMNNKKNGYKSAIISSSFLHEHSISINKSIRSEIRKNKIFWKSRMIVLKKHYGVLWIFRPFCLFIKWLAELEFFFKEQRKNEKH